MKPLPKCPHCGSKPEDCKNDSRGLCVKDPNSVDKRSKNA